MDPELARTCYGLYKSTNVEALKLWKDDQQPFISLNAEVAKL